MTLRMWGLLLPTLQARYNHYLPNLLHSLIILKTFCLSFSFL